MIKLRQYIRKMLLTEAMKMPADLSDNMYVLIEKNRAGDYFEVTINDAEQYWSSHGIIAELMVGKADDHNGLNCDGAWVIIGSEAEQGYGPLVYDIAMEYVGDDGLMCDRADVSFEAADVWDFYLSSRPDVKAVQLDFHEKPFLTPNNMKDDCDGQYTLARHVDRDLAVGLDPVGNSYHKRQWMDHWSTKKYVKQGTPIMDELKKRRAIYFDRDDTGHYYF